MIKNIFITLFLMILFINSIVFAASDYLGGTFFGTESKDSVQFIKIGNNGDIYIAGVIGDLNLQNVNGFDTIYDSNSEKLAYIARFDSSLTTLKSFTYVGDSYSYFWDFKISENGDIYVISFPFDFNLDNVNGYDTQYTSSGNMLIRFDENLEQIKNFTFLYNIATAGINSMAFDKNGDIIIAGEKFIDNTNNVYNTDIYIGIISKDLTEVKKSYIYGGSAYESPKQLYVDKSNNIFLLGITSSSDFITNQYSEKSLTNESTSSGGMFISKFDSELNLTKTSFITSDSGSGGILTGDNNGNLFLSIRSNSSIFTNNNSSEEYHPVIVKLDNELTNIQNYFAIDYSVGDYINTMECDSKGRVYIGGSVYKTNETNFPFTEGAWQPDSYSLGVGMLMVLENDLYDVDYATLIGGSYAADSIIAIAVSDSNIVYTGGYAQTADFPVENSNGYQTSCAKGIGGSCYDGFIVKFDPFYTGTNTILSSYIAGFHVKLSWNNAGNYNDYILYYAPYPYTGPETIGTVDLGNMNSIEFDLWQDAAYYIAVMPYDSNNNAGELSNVELLQIN